jgi:hypothetical protein
MSTLFYQHLCDIRNESLIKAKLAYEKDVTYRLVTDVIDKLEIAKDSLRGQARDLKSYLGYEFVVELSDIQAQHRHYLATVAAGQSPNNTIDMVQALLKRRLPEEFSGMTVTLVERRHDLVYTVEARA